MNVNWIGGGHAEQQSRHDLRGGQRPGAADDDADDRQSHGAAEHHDEHAPAVRAERLAHANLVDALGDRVRHHAIDPDGRQQECESGEGGQHQALKRRGPSEPPMMSSMLCSPNITMPALTLLAARLRAGAGAYGSPSVRTTYALPVETRSITLSGNWRERDVHLRPDPRRRIGVQSPLLDVADDADDLALHGQHIEPDVPAERIL